MSQEVSKPLTKSKVSGRNVIVVNQSRAKDTFIIEDDTKPANLFDITGKSSDRVVKIVLRPPSSRF